MYTPITPKLGTPLQPWVCFQCPCYSDQLTDCSWYDTCVGQLGACSSWDVSPPRRALLESLASPLGGSVIGTWEWEEEGDAAVETSLLGNTLVLERQGVDMCCGMCSVGLSKVPDPNTFWNCKTTELQVLYWSSQRALETEVPLLTALPLEPHTPRIPSKF